MNNSDRIRYANIKSMSELRVEKRILAHRIQEKEVRFEGIYDSVRAAITKVSNLISSFVVSVTLVKTFWLDIQDTITNGSDIFKRIKGIFSKKKEQSKTADSVNTDE